MTTLRLPSLLVALIGLSILLKPFPAMAQPPALIYPWLDSWSFPTGWYTDAGYAPMAYTNVSNQAIWDGGSVFIDTTNESPAYLRYYSVEPGDSHTNILLQSGSLSFVYAPNWASTNQDGYGPRDYACLIAIGHSTTNASYGFWGLYIDPNGTNLCFTAQTNNGTGANFLSAPISWTSNNFHWIGLTWTSNTSALYVDGILLTNGSGVTVWPGQSVYTNGLFIGSDDEGLHQARGQIGDIDSYLYVYEYQDGSYFTNCYDTFWGPLITAWDSVGGAGPDFSGPGGGGLLGSGTTLTVTGGRIFIASVSAVLTNNGTMNVTLGLEGGYTNVLYPIYSSTNAALPLAGWSYVGLTNTDCYITITNQSTNAAYYLVEAPLPTNGLKLWLRADADIILGGGTNIQTWVDQSPNGNNFGQNNTTIQPTFVVGQLNGKPVVRFSEGGSQYLSNFSGFFTNGPAGEAFALIKAAGDGTGGPGLWSFGNTESGYYGYPRPDGTIAETFGLGNASNMALPIHPITNYHIYHISAGSNNWVARINGGVQYAAPGSTFQCSTTTSIGAGGNPYSPTFQGDIVEVLMYNRTLATSERDGAMTYLSQKYALVTNVPATPINLTAAAVSTNQIALTWNASMGNFKTEFIIERKTGSGGTYAQIGEVDNGLTYFDTGLAANTQYYYRIFAANYAGDSLYSAETNATTPPSGTTLPVSDLKLWLKADTGVVYDLTNTVGQWLDQTTNGNNAYTTTVVGAPSWQTNQINGLPAVQFAFQGLQLPNFLTTNMETAVEGFALVQAVYDSNGGLWSFGDSGNSTLGYPRYNGTIVDSFGTTASAGFISFPAPSVITNYHIYNVSSASNSLIARINGTIEYSNNVNTVGFPTAPGQNTTLGATGGSANGFAGNMAEIMIFDRVLTTNERTTVLNYLNGKYGL